ncbi:MAG: hypothetical protein Q8920_08695 [Bacillota bacterium]|nr:hypothetical protein [Bacillota bacterium]
MGNQTIVEEIKCKNIDVEYFSKRIIKDESLRNELVRQLLTNKDIMVYYHCFYVISRASEIRADLFYTYWHDFELLLSHKNSYHRDIGATIIANLVCADKNHYFYNIIDDYLMHINNDEKFMTAQCFVRNLAKIAKSTKDLWPKIVGILLAVDKNSSYPEKQRELLKSSILEVFDVVYEECDLKNEINSFIQAALTSSSPKTRKKAIELVKKYHLLKEEKEI